MQVSNISNSYNLNKIKNNKANPQQSPAFKGFTPKPVVDGLSKFYTNVAKTDVFKNGIAKFSKSDKSFTHLMVLDSIILSTFYTINSLRNKKIAKEQKPQMVINDALTLGVSAAGSYLLDDKVSTAVSKFGEKFLNNNKEFYEGLGKKAQEKLGSSAPKEKMLAKIEEVLNPENASKLKEGAEEVAGLLQHQFKSIVSDKPEEKAFSIAKDKFDDVQRAVKDAITSSGKDETVDVIKTKVTGLTDGLYSNLAARHEADKFLGGLNKLKVLIVFGIIYRYLGPVLITPIANKLSSKLFDNKIAEKKDTAKPETKTEAKK